ncbi:sensor histidine kinase [Dyella sp.]|uniref:sensor histidine kinase n=1 Tax=Dyella sp. TaxID=1869338 RepID=UPI002D78E433|nr:sensor histidine kinase [Dyella sp.]HET7332274.1 sensor histidine kinase [Dyella sp.]
MKPEIRGFWAGSAARVATAQEVAKPDRPLRPFSAFAALIFSLALLAALGAFLSLAVSGIQRADECLHLTQASWQEVASSGFSAPPASLDSRSLPDEWRATALPLSLHAASPANAHRIIWVRLSVTGPQSVTESLALYGARLKTDGPVALYVNGKLVYRGQQRGQQWNSLFTPLWVPLEPGVSEAPVREILVRLEHTAQYPVAVSSLWLGPADALRGRYQTRQWLQQGLPAMLNAAFLAVGVFALFVWFKRKHEPGYLLFFNLAVIAFAAHLHYYVDLPIANDWFGWLVVNSLCWLLTVGHFFLRLLHGRPLRWLSRGMIAAPVLIGVATMPVSWALPNTQFMLAVIYALELMMAMVVGLVGGICTWRSSREGRLVVVAVAICVLLGVSDWMMHNNVVSPEGWFLGAYTNGVTFIFFGLLMYRRYMHAIEEVERVNASLAERLRLREVELEQSHQRLREIEQRQLLSDERQRLMQDMHDGLGSTLISAIRSVEQGRMGDTEVSQILKDCMDDLKLAIDSMEPVEADLLLLLATLRFRLEPRMEGANVALVWDVGELPPLDWLDPSSALNILRIVQESVANILRHTRATVIRVATAAESAGVQVIIEDNGQGFDVATALWRSTGRGLQNQQRRAQAIDGRVDWKSGDTGTRFTLWLPLQRGI